MRSAPTTLPPCRPLPPDAHEPFLWTRAHQASVSAEPACSVCGPRLSLHANWSALSQVHMNHSRGRANVKRFYARAQRRISFFTTRDVQPGEELLYE